MRDPRFPTGVLHFAVLLGSAASAQFTQRVDVSSAGSPVHDGAPWANTVSGDGRRVVFVSTATNLVPNDGNQKSDVFLRDRETGTTEIVSLDSAGHQANDHSWWTAVSADGRFVAFESTASNLVAGDTNGWGDVFVRDRQSRTTERVSVDSAGGEGSRGGGVPAISADGRFVCFLSDSPDLVPNDTNGRWDAFLRDRLAGTTVRVSTRPDGVQGNGDAWTASISADGQVVLFASTASNLVPEDPNQSMDAIVRDLRLDTIEVASLGTNGVHGNGWSNVPTISPDGRYVAFVSNSTNLGFDVVPGIAHVYVKDRRTGVLEIASVADDGRQGNGKCDRPTLSADGRTVAFESEASNLVPSDTNHAVDVFVRDLDAGTTERASVASDGSEGQPTSDWLTSNGPSISADGRRVVFTSPAANLVPDDSNGLWDVFLRDRSGAPSIEFLCEPGIGGVIACPCGNPPAGPRRGCDNSSGTGGAKLYAYGGTFVSSDSLVFQVHEYGRDTLRFFLQGSTTIASGVVYGQGVRCAGGRILRLYTRSGPWRTFSVPNHDAGELPVTARSAALGDVIRAGETRAYFVSYRDATVLGGCPTSRTFNATQTGVVNWAP